jgi:uncharacterized protein (DUF58 family)
MTARGWWCLFSIAVMLLAGVLRGSSALIVPALALGLWFGWEWLFFAVRVRTLRGRLRIERVVLDERGPVTTLWAGRSFTVRVELHLLDGARVPYLLAYDPVPFGMRHESGETGAEGELRLKNPLRIEYTAYCPLTGVARFEGLRIETSDLQGFFAHVLFLRAPVVLRILPAALVRKGGGPTVKRHNELPPPGIHRLKQPGSGGELLDLRDYLPGDPPRTIAWKVSARRDRLVTKVFESEIPVRCTLFLDTSSSVRVPSPPSAERPSAEHPGATEGSIGTRSEREGEPDRPGPKKSRPGAAYFKPLDRLVELAAGVIRSSASIRDLTGLCLFDEQSSRVVRPERTATHRNRLLGLLAEATALSPVAARANPDELTPIAAALAQEVYPDLLRDEVNRMPGWLAWLVAFPRYTRHKRGLLDALHRNKATILLWCVTVLPLSLLAVNVLSLFFGWVPNALRTVLGGLLLVVPPLAATVGWVLFLFSLLVSGKKRRMARWRKRLSALFVVEHGPIEGGVEALLQDDDLFSMHVQQFLAEHQVPVYVPLYDEAGRYQFAYPEKVRVLSRAILQATARGRDNELYVILADLLDLDAHLEPLLAAVRVALGRHHQVLVVCPWPQGVPPPEEEGPRRVPRKDNLRGLITGLAFKQIHAAYGRIRRTFARLGVQVVCAASEESVPLILNRLERIRSMGGRR